MKLPIFAHGFPIKTFKSATGYVITCTTKMHKGERSFNLRPPNAKRSRPISRILFLLREDHHPSRSAIARRFKQPTWRIGRAAHRLSGLAPSGVYLAIYITADAVVSYTAVSPLPLLLEAVIFCGTVLRIAPSGC